MVGMMPETLQTGATKSNMDGPRLWSQGSGSQAYVLATDLSKAYRGSTRNCEDGKSLGH